MAARRLMDITDAPIEEIAEHFISLPWVISTGLVSAGIGAGVGYFIAKKRLEKEYDDFALESIREVREHYESIVTREEFNTTLAEKPPLEELVVDLGYVAGDVPKVSPSLAEGTQKVAYHKPPPTVVKNVFEQAQPDDGADVWDYKVEIDKRDPSQPYIIHKDEFNELDGDEVERSTLTYFEGDEVLCDERDTPVDDKDSMVGLDNLEHFGHGSEDVNVVYVRNEPLETIFEIVRSDGLFAQEVHGFQPEELEHSAIRRRPRRDFHEE